MEFKGYKGYPFVDHTGERSRAFECRCCTLPTIYEPEAYEICPICGWEDDFSTEAGGANRLSLSDYKKKYLNKENTRYEDRIKILKEFKICTDEKQRGVI